MVEVNVKGGTIKGISDGQIDRFLGIPYAQPFNATSRFKHSQLNHGISNSYIDARKVQPIPPQPYNALEDFFSTQQNGFNSFIQNENCLYLNIWRKSCSSKIKPVVVYFYGGGFTQGHGTADLYNPYHIVEHEDIIVITFNYRLGALGFLDWSALDPQFDYNNGLSDQMNALKWVHHYIEYFGGDPNNVTLMGQSAGSMSILALMQIPELDTYYHKVMLLSGALFNETKENAQLKANHFSTLINTYYPGKSLESLTHEDILRLMDLHESERGKSRSLDLIYRPIQSPIMTRTIDDFPKPVFMSFTNSEGDIYIENESRTLSPSRFVEVMKLYDIDISKNHARTAQQQRELITQYYFIEPAIHLLQHIHTPHKWLARFDWCRPNSTHFKTAYHILDIVFWFGHLDILTTNQYDIIKSDIDLSQRMISDLAYFARYSEMPWSPYQRDTQSTFIYK